VEGTGPQGRVTKSDVEAALEADRVIEAVPSKIRATPASRRIAREEGVDLAAVSGSGPRGRVQADDVRAFVAQREEAAEPAAEVVPLAGMRRTIAERMTSSYRTAPHITLGIDVDVTAFEEARDRLNVRAQADGETRVSITALLVKAVAWALERHPWLNSTLRDEEIHLLPEINVGVAVALEAGLIVPVVKQADRKSVGQIAAEVEELVERARQDRLRPSDVAGGTFTVSNLGPFGIDEFTAIINPPEAAILAVGAVRPRLVPDGEGGAMARPTMHVTLSADHRIVDGATAARFLSDLREGLEDPPLLLW
jgi:pyruvate dehydrogenase E2 component (dihydrolipoamide acetyltransferase)